MLLPALLEIEVDHHCGVTRDFLHQGSEVSERISTKHVVLKPHPIGVADFLNAGGEVAMPKKGHFLEQWRRPIKHPIDPPAPEVDHFVALHHSDIADFAPKIVSPFLGRPDFHALSPDVSWM